MNSEELKSLQAPLKDKYRNDPESAVVTLKAQGKIGEGISCKVETGRTLVNAGLHPATGGNGLMVCSGDMLLEALVACAGVTLNAVATAIEVEIKDATVKAEGDIDFRGTLGVAKDVSVGFKEIRLQFMMDSTAAPDKI
ncbi:MAG: OsmC family protein, partial [Flavisolibacter sp.]|nr:OsmC family protein [Flavisolibacter sp.]